MDEHDQVDQARPNAEVACGGCRTFIPGHMTHPIQARLASESPWGWRDGVIASLCGQKLRVAYVFVAGSVRCWHHVDLSAELQAGDPVRLHEGFHLLAGPMGIVCVSCAGGLGAVPEPEHPELSRSEREPILVDLATGRGIGISSNPIESPTTVEASTTAAEPLILLADDVLSFKDRRVCLVARSADAAITLLREHAGDEIAELWLDHDLGQDASGRALTVMPVVEELVAAARGGRLFSIGTILVHTANPSGSVAMRRALEPAGYRVRRWYDTRIWRNARLE